MFDVMSYIQGPTFEIAGTVYGAMTVTKEIALLALGSKWEGQRNEQASWVESLCREVEGLRFLTNNGQTLVFDERGNLLDGQHRLETVAKTGMPQTFAVAVVKAEVAQSMFDTIDNGKKRSNSMYLSGPQKAARNTVATVDYCIRHGETPLLTSIQGKVTPRSNATRTEVLNHNRDNEARITKMVREAARIRSAIGKGSYQGIGAFLSVVRFVHTDELIDEFIDDITSAVPDSRTVQACLNGIRKQYLAGHAPTAKWILGMLLDAYEHYRAMDDSTMLNKQSQRLNEYNKKVLQERASLGLG